MPRQRFPLCLLLFLIALQLALPLPGTAQGTLRDYLRADSINDLTRGLVLSVLESPTWIGETNRLWYRKSVEGGNSFVLVNAETQERAPAFDHERLAATLAAFPALTDSTITAVKLPFTRFEFTAEEDAIEFTLADSTWRCGLDDYQCENRGAARQGQGRGGGGGVGPSGVTWTAGPGQLWRNLSTDPILSPDSTMEASIQNYNVAVRKVGSEEYTMLSFEGSEGNTYTNRSLVWSPDSKKIAVYRVVPGHAREVHLVESSPDDQVQPKHSTLLYAKPGDVLDKEIPVIFDVATGKQMIVDDALFPNAYTLSRLEWREDSGHITFEYNQRGHQVYRILEVDAGTGSARAVISEEAETFVDYSNKTFREDMDAGREIVWMSERDGWAHLYLYDGATGRVKNQITRGDWVVRGVDSVDVANRQIWFRASGMNPGQDPYFIHHYRINFDGTGLVTYTEA
ncbi:MAG: DPP IV N-terminal domain-containing protein, partial [Longimicrobiales bacterium]|nr:DPP IV N-terminal domain-containing protein [Longimicrobiales bacterium]